MEKPLLKVKTTGQKKQVETKQEITKAESQQEKVIDPWAVILFGPAKK